MDQVDIGVLLNSAITQYVFNKTFEAHNNGKKFNALKWVSDIQELTSDSMFSISTEKQKKLAELLENLDDYAMDGNEDPAAQAGPKLVLD